MFDVRIKWTREGRLARQLYINNHQVQNVGAFLDATNSFLRAFATMRFSQQNPAAGPHINASGQLNWTENGVARSEAVLFAYTCPQWAAQQRMTLQVEGMN